MEPMVKTYCVKVVREAGIEPISGQFYGYSEQEINIEATSPKNAYQVSHLVCDIPFRGQVRRTFIDGAEYLDERF